MKDADEYFNEDTTDFYQQVCQEFNGEKINPTMVDKNGNIQTKPLPENSSYKSDLIPLDNGWNKQAYGREYRTEDYEVIYKREAFNLWTGDSPTDNKLSSNYRPPSHYTSFKVDLLKRTNYLYLDSDTICSLLQGVPIGLTENFSDKSSSQGKFLAAIFFGTLRRGDNVGLIGRLRRENFSAAFKATDDFFRHGRRA